MSLIENVGTCYESATMTIETLSWGYQTSNGDMNETAVDNNWLLLQTLPLEFDSDQLCLNFIFLRYILNKFQSL